MSSPKNQATGGNPATVVYYHRTRDERHILPVSVTSGRDHRLLGDDNITTNMNIILVMDPNAFPDPASVTDAQFPREFHSGSGPEDNTFTYFRTKKSKNGNSQSRTYLPRAVDED